MLNTPGVYDLGDFSIDAAETQTGAVVDGLAGIQAATLSAKLNYGSGGGTAIATVYTSLNQGWSWIPIARFEFATAGAEKVFNLSALTPKTTVYPVAALASETAIDGILGDRFKAEVVSTGTYAGSTTLSLRLNAR